MADGANGDELQTVLGTRRDAQIKQAAMSCSCVLASAMADDCLVDMTAENIDGGSQVAVNLDRIITIG